MTLYIVIRRDISVYYRYIMSLIISEDTTERKDMNNYTHSKVWCNPEERTTVCQKHNVNEESYWFVYWWVYFVNTEALPSNFSERKVFHVHETTHLLFSLLTQDLINTQARNLQEKEKDIANILSLEEWSSLDIINEAFAELAGNLVSETDLSKKEWDITKINKILWVLWAKQLIQSEHDILSLFREMEKSWEYNKKLAAAAMGWWSKKKKEEKPLQENQTINVM